MQDHTGGRYTQYLRDLRDETQEELDSYQSTGQDWDRSNLSELRRRLRDRERDLSLYTT